MTPHKNAKQKSSRGGVLFSQFVKEHYIVCQVCVVEDKRKTLPKTAIPRASNFNQLITLDLKYNTKYAEKSSPYILYIIDAFTRYKVAVFLKDK